MFKILFQFSKFELSLSSANFVISYPVDFLLAQEGDEFRPIL